MSSLVKLTPIITSAACRRILARSSRYASSSSLSKEEQIKNDPVKLKKFDPHNYHFEPRILTMDDHMEPYGSWKQAYEAERKLGNKMLIQGIICFTAALTILICSPATEGLLMPNLDNIMEDTVPSGEDMDVDMADRKVC